MTLVGILFGVLLINSAYLAASSSPGDFIVEYSPLHDLATSKNPILNSLHDWLLYL